MTVRRLNTTKTPFVVTYHPRLPDISKILRDLHPILESLVSCALFINSIMRAVQVINELTQLLLSLRPNNENIVNVPPPNAWFYPAFLIKRLSSLSIKMFAYEGAILVPIAVPRF